MTDTYARVMRPTDVPGDRRTTRSRAPRRSDAVPDSAAGTPAVPGVSRGVADASGSAAREMPPSMGVIGAPRTPAAKSRTPAAKSRTPSRAAASASPGDRTPSRAAATASPGEATFAAAVAAFMAGRDAQVQRDLLFEDVAAPKRLAPYATAIAATVQRDDADVAWGRLVLLYDPDGQQGWDGFFRLVAYIRADVEPEMAADPLLGEVGWSWLSEALDAHVPGYAVPSGTVTRVITEGFGAKRDELPLTGFELRASWSPAGPGNQPGFADHGELDALDLSAHIAAWCDCLSAAAGLEPPGTRALRQP